MRNAAEWLDLFKSRTAIRSDYKLAKRWSVEPSRISQYRRGRLKLPLAVVLDIAEELGRDPLEIIVTLAYPKTRERDRPQLEAAYWRVCIKGVSNEMAANSIGSGYFRRR